LSFLTERLIEFCSQDERHRIWDEARDVYQNIRDASNPFRAELPHLWER
jgi:hypothetical protein